MPSGERVSLSSVPIACVTLISFPALYVWLAISNTPASRLVYRSSVLVCSGNQQGRTKATAVRVSLPLDANAISTYPTPGSRKLPLTTWSAIAVFKRSDNRMLEIDHSKPPGLDYGQSHGSETKIIHSHFCLRSMKNNYVR